MTYTTRREFLGTLAFASIRGILPASTRGTSGVNSSAARLDRRDFAPVRNKILKEIARGGATGVAVAVACNGKIVWEEGFGWANREAAVKATSRMPFNLASLTKPFTTTTLMTLVAEGKLHQRSRPGTGIRKPTYNRAEKLSPRREPRSSSHLSRSGLPAHIARHAGEIAAAGHHHLEAILHERQRFLGGRMVGRCRALQGRTTCLSSCVVTSRLRSVAVGDAIGASALIGGLEHHRHPRPAARFSAAD